MRQHSEDRSSWGAFIELDNYLKCSLTLAREQVSMSRSKSMDEPQTDRVSARAWVTLAILVLIYILSFLDRGLISFVGKPIREEKRQPGSSSIFKTMLSGRRYHRAAGNARARQPQFLELSAEVVDILVLSLPTGHRQLVDHAGK
jgi:hypothetical protein